MLPGDFISGRAIFRSINFRCADFNTNSADACILVMACVDCARVHLKTLSSLLKVAEHSFQVPMPNSPLLSNHLCFGARFFARVKVIHRSIYSRILVRVCAVAMATVLVKNEA